MSPDPASFDSSRYIRQERFAPLGAQGQRRLAQGRVLICGCGALGSTAAGLLVRAGVGFVRIVDRDFAELDNLHRQSLFDEADVAAGLPKAVAAAEKLRTVNSTVRIEPIVTDIEPSNIERFCRDIDVMVDGTDNFETRFLMNDAAVRWGIPWIYGGCVGAEGRTMTILPGETACLRCLLGDCPAPGSGPTCDTAGILGPIVGVVASIQAGEAIKILSGNRAAVSRRLVAIDLWENRLREIELAGLREAADCPTCLHGEFPWLSGGRGSRTAVLCGRNAVQLSHPGLAVSLDEMARRWAATGRVTANAFLVRLAVESFEITLFADGRAIIQGTDDVAIARTVYAKYVGN